MLEQHDRAQRSLAAMEPRRTCEFKHETRAGADVRCTHPPTHRVVGRARTFDGCDRHYWMVLADWRATDRYTALVKLGAPLAPLPDWATALVKQAS